VYALCQGKAVQRFTFHIVNQLSLYSEPFCSKMMTPVKFM